MTTTSNLNTKFEFRTKFKKLLNAENCTTVISAFNQFCNLDSVDALEVLWRMTYSQEKALEEVHKLGLDSKIIPAEKVLVLRNELRYQYEEWEQEGFMEFYEHDDEKIRNAFEILKKCSDPIVASKVYDECKVHSEKPEVERTLYLLKSEKDTFYFGGIRALGFDMVEAEYLKPFHLEIHNILEAIANYIPFYLDEEEEQIVKEMREEEEEEEEDENDTQELKKFKLITPEALIIHKDIFDQYVFGNDLNILIEIANLGFDLNEVIPKAEKIKNFMIAAENLN